MNEGSDVMTTADEPVSAAERAYQVIRNSILEHTYKTGTMLGESTIATELGMSRTPVRVALARLQDEGWILVYPKRGAIVQGISERTVTDLSDTRFILESAAIDRANPQTRKQLAERLSASIQEQQDAFDNRDVGRFIDLTLKFHRGFVEISHNAVLLELYEGLGDRHRFVLFGAGDRLLARCENIIAEHKELVEHLRNGDSTTFSRALLQHITDTRIESIDVHDQGPQQTSPPRALKH